MRVPLSDADADDPLYLVEGIEIVAGFRATTTRRAEAFIRGTKAADAKARDLREAGWVSVRCVRWEET